MDKSKLDAVKAEMVETKKIQEKTLGKLQEVMRMQQGSMDAAQLKELKRAVKTVEASLKLYSDF